MEGELIFVGFIMLIGQIILMYMWNANWFKKENFKMQKSLVMKQNNLKLKKLERDLNLVGGSKLDKEEKGLGDLIKGLDTDKIKGLLDMVQGEEDEDGEGGGLGGIIDNLPPDLVKNFVEGLKSGKKNETETTSQV